MAGDETDIREFSDPPPQAMVARLRTTRQASIPPASFAYHTVAADPDLVARKIAEPEIMVQWSIGGRRASNRRRRLVSWRACRCAEERGWLDASADHSQRSTRPPSTVSV